ncbi:flagellar biosynthesis protein FlhB [Chitinispirillales bacterium ANBcel5]|uniref:flagellar biosynthesis protein FlhB n=1 Tax=Cellulosispirillum alkaliphilum TaxID=3039283 RepID=UPI002A50D6FD|nr:flagellar biosynthesis protein FlhB [Chitinispirillales bacterium ANBcel5]
MAEDTTEEKSEAPSEKRRQDSREKGTVAKSTEVNSVMVLLTALFMMRLTGPWLIDELVAGINEFFAFGNDISMSVELCVQVLRSMIFLALRTILPIVGSILVIGVIANIIQIGFLFTLQPLTPKLEKISPLSGAKRLFSMRSLVELMKNLFKLIIIGTVAYLTIRGEYDRMLVLSDASVLVIWNFILEVAFKMILRVALVLILIAVLDYGYQRFEHEKKLKMTHQEVKEERKQMEGDPQIKSRVRALQREMARRRMMQEVPKATVVITNPTHIAIALRYEPSESEAPIVIAKGKKHSAEKIKQLANEHNVPIVEDKPLARAMYDKIEVGFEIPMEFFTAVAEIMAYVFKLKNKSAA